MKELSEEVKTALQHIEQDQFAEYYHRQTNEGQPEVGQTGFQFVERDFNSCTGTKEDAKYLQDRFGDLEDLLIPILEEKFPPLKFSHIPKITNYKPPNSPGPITYHEGMWLSISVIKFQLGNVMPQFQVMIDKVLPLFFGMWVDKGSTSESKERVTTELLGKKEEFISTLKGKGFVILRAPKDAKIESLNLDTASAEDVSSFVRALDQSSHLAIGRRLSKADAISLGENAVPTIVQTVEQLYPIYEMVGPVQEGTQEKDPSEDLAIAHLIAGKNVIIYGPPGTGKTRLANAICNRVCGPKGFAIETGNSEWGYSEVVLGYEPTLPSGVVPTPGFFTRAVMESVKTQKPFWLIIDEINRANLDLAFGRVFTLLDIEYREREELLDKDKYEAVSKAPKTEGLKVPASFRVVATMNTYDRSLLFSLGYAFMRRFAFVEQPSKIPPKELTVAPPSNPDLASIGSAVDWARGEGNPLVQNMILEKIKEHFDVPDSVVLNDLNDPDDVTSSLLGLNLQIKDMGTLNPFQVLLALAKLLADLQIAEVGQALVIDASKFLVACSLLTDEDPNEDSVKDDLDQAVLSYILPQIEFFMPKLRRETVLESGESTYGSKWETLKQFAHVIDLRKTLKRLAQAKETSRLL